MVRFPPKKRVGFEDHVPHPGRFLLPSIEPWWMELLVFRILLVRSVNTVPLEWETTMSIDVVTTSSGIAN
jgi:hypothetical protein